MLNPAVSNLIKEMKKACPFCGGSAHLWRWGRKFDKTSRQYVEKVKADIRAERGV